MPISDGTSLPPQYTDNLQQCSIEMARGLQMDNPRWFKFSSTIVSSVDNPIHSSRKRSLFNAADVLEFPWHVNQTVTVRSASSCLLETMHHSRSCLDVDIFMECMSVVIPVPQYSQAYQPKH
ncbi:hypothetical protein CBL_11934 [Carabus blaptoides fortunei]